LLPDQYLGTLSLILLLLLEFHFFLDEQRSMVLHDNKPHSLGLLSGTVMETTSLPKNNPSITVEKHSQPDGRLIPPNIFDLILKNILERF
jgi:hypothetical protein